MFAEVDADRIHKNRARWRVGVGLAAQAVLIGLTADAVLPGVGVWLATVIGLVGFFFIGLGHTAAARDRAAQAAQAWADRLATSITRRQQHAGRRLAAILRFAFLRKPRPTTTPRLAAGQTLSPRILPVPRLAAA